MQAKMIRLLNLTAEQKYFCFRLQLFIYKTVNKNVEAQKTQLPSVKISFLFEKEKKSIILYKIVKML